MNFLKVKKSDQYTIIVGCGRLGAGLANRLSLQNQDVLMMDEDEYAFRKLATSYGGLTLIGDGRELNKLEEAEIRKADIFIAVTDNDNTNLFLAGIAKQIYGVKHVLTRIYDEEKADLLEDIEVESFCPSELSEKEIGRFMDWRFSDEN